MYLFSKFTALPAINQPFCSVLGDSIEISRRDMENPQKIIDIAPEKKKGAFWQNGSWRVFDGSSASYETRIKILVVFNTV